MRWFYVPNFPTIIVIHSQFFHKFLIPAIHGIKLCCTWYPMKVPIFSLLHREDFLRLHIELKSDRSSLNFLASRTILPRKNAITDLHVHVVGTFWGGVRKWNCIAEQSIPPYLSWWNRMMSATSKRKFFSASSLKNGCLMVGQCRNASSFSPLSKSSTYRMLIWVSY